MARPSRPQVPDTQFRVLIVGRANAGKTSILQRVCETTESPLIYRGNKKVRRPRFCLRVFTGIAHQVTLSPTMEVSDNRTSQRLPLNV